MQACNEHRLHRDLVLHQLERGQHSKACSCWGDTKGKRSLPPVSRDGMHGAAEVGIADGVIGGCLTVQAECGNTLRTHCFFVCHCSSD